MHAIVVICSMAFEVRYLSCSCHQVSFVILLIMVIKLKEGTDVIMYNIYY